MEEYEADHGVYFDVIVTHDAEDMIHPEALRFINWYSRDYAMVQIPVLALPTPVREFTHGIYCDEFAEFQLKDVPVRQRLGGFLPSNGVGCGFARDALKKLAEAREGRIFDPACLTEDYENGFRLHALGLPQIFVPLRLTGGAPMATREYFPRKVRQAMRQRSRWVLGITLQGWQHFGWKAPWLQRYWLWRDRKGLVGNLLSPVANLTFVYGLVWGHWLSNGPNFVTYIYSATCSITLFQTLLRAECCARIYGWRYAAFVPLRVFWGNVVNFSATSQALGQFLQARIQRGTLTWRKTEHSYPMHQANDQGRARLGELLVRMHCITTGDVEDALRTLPTGVRLGEYLLNLRQISEDKLYEALSSQAGIPLGAPSREEVSRLATRMLPAETARRWKVMPYRVDLGQLHVVTSEVPSEEMARELSAISTLEVRFRLIRPQEFERMTGEYLPAA
jgi:adsorption protein B